jgi:hypothetical protein
MWFISSETQIPFIAVMAQPKKAIFKLLQVSGWQISLLSSGNICLFRTLGLLHGRRSGYSTFCFHNKGNFNSYLYHKARNCTFASMSTVCKYESIDEYCKYECSQNSFWTCDTQNFSCRLLRIFVKWKLKHLF